ncbi:MAG: putative porin [Solirubrobacteraceae bacterium]
MGQAPTDYNIEEELDSIKNINRTNQEIVDLKNESLINNRTKDSVLFFIPTKNDYKVFKSNLDTINIVTDLTINDFYEKNTSGKDYFGKMNPNNIGRAFNELSYFPQEFSNNRLLPVGKKNYYISEKEVRYFDVKTPTTIFDYESGIKQGQALSTLFTHSPNSKINYSIQYTGLRSLGRYQNESTSNNAFILGLSLRNKKNNYKLLTHYAIQNTDNQENGGIADRSLFETKNGLYNTRTTIPVNLEGVSSKFHSKRFYVKQLFAPFSLNKKLSWLELNNTLSLEENQYFYSENNENTFFSSSAIIDVSRRNETKQFNIENRFGLTFKNKTNFLAEVGYLYSQTNYNLLERTNTIPTGLNNLFNGVYGNFTGKISTIVNLNSSIEYGVNSNFQNPHLIKLRADFFKENKIQLFANYTNQSAIPRFNTVLSQNFYQDYNFYNPNFKNENTQTLELGISLKSIKTTISSSINNIENYIYFDQNYLAKQLNSPVKLISIDFQNSLNYKKINLVSTIRFQEIQENKEFFPLPSLIARSTLFYQSMVFKSAAELETGININYFSAFQSREISPLNNEFKLQNSNNTHSIGNVPMLDYFVNLKVSRMKIYLKLENISSFFTKSYYVLPNVPYTDWRIRAGIKWYLFS